MRKVGAMMVQRTERHIFTTKDFDDICLKSKNLYNYCNYILRQCVFGKFDNIPEFIDLVENGFIPEYSLSKKLAKINHPDFRALPAQTAQQTIKLLYKNWKAFFKATSAWRKRCRDFRHRPKPPRYKKDDEKFVVVFTNQQVRVKNGLLHFPAKANISPIVTKVEPDKISQVRIIPKPSCYVVEVVYTKEIIHAPLDYSRYLGIDMGIDNFVTAVDSFSGEAFIINGRTVKSINQYFNKNKAKLMSFVGNRGTSKRIKRLAHKRNCKVMDYLHKASRFVISYCIEHTIGNIVVGYNKCWKEGVNLGKVNNQKFVSIPHTKFIQMLKYKAEEVGINVITVDECYTSKCDALALEQIRKHTAYCGRRIKRGLFQSAAGKLVNADVNGAMNILRKVIGDSFVKRIVDRGVVPTPARVNIL